MPRTGKGYGSAIPPPKARPTRRRATPDAAEDSQDVCAGTDLTVGTGISSRIGPSMTSRNAPVTDKEMLHHLTMIERVSFGMVMQAIMDYWHESKFEEQLSDLCSNRIWIDRLVAQPMYKCTIAFCNRCKIIARSQESGEQTFKVHADITCALQMLYEDLQTYIVESNNSDKVHHHKRYRRILDFNADG